MPELRWALVGLGLLFLLGLGLWEWRRSGRRHAARGSPESAVITEPVERARRIEPSIDGHVGHVGSDPDNSLEVPTIHPGDPVLIGVANETAVDIPTAARFEMRAEPAPSSIPTAVPLPVQIVPAAPIQWPPQHSERVLSLRLVGAQGAPLPGRALRIALEAAGLVHGPQQIFHLVTDEGEVLVSAANLVRPGSFDPAIMDAQEFRGLNLFSVLPGALSSVRMLEELVAVARGLAHRLSGIVLDESGADLDGMRLSQMRLSLPDDSGSGDGSAP
jgi:ZipA, C-terminal FtsZ-binding domain